jgi:hypothetical protein
VEVSGVTAGWVSVLNCSGRIKSPVFCVWFFLELVFMVFFCALLFGIGLSPFTGEDCGTGRPVEVAFRRNHEGPLWQQAGEGERKNRRRGSKSGKDLKAPGNFVLPWFLPVSKLNRAGTERERSAESE